jgi:DNA-binding transcriptional LysR family regulator
MRDAHLRNVDLNLLRAIQPLLEERHISRAAKRAFLSQPAMSRALNGLRATFGDPLLVRSDGTYERTPRGERVLRETEAIMRRLNALVNDQEFIPAQSRERFRIAMTDHGSTILLPNVLERLRRNAPDSELVLSAVGPHTYDEVAAGRIDLILLRRRGSACAGKRDRFQPGLYLSRRRAPTNQEPPIYTETISTTAACDGSDR